MGSARWSLQTSHLILIMSFPIWFIVFGFVLGTVLGSLLKVLADRGLSGKSFFGRSCCLDCQKKLLWYDLVPLVSYILLKGRCRYCRKKIGWEYPAVEIISGILIGYLFFLSYSTLPELSDPLKLILFSLELVFKIFFITVLLSLFLTDYKKMLIPDRIILPSIIISAIFIFVINLYKVAYLYIYLQSHPIGKYLLPPYSSYFQDRVLSNIQDLFTHIGAGLGLGTFFLLLILLTKGKGMGGGDVKLGMFMGIALGPINTIIATTLAFFTGAIFSIFLILVKKGSLKSVVPFGPFLVIGSLVALFWGNWILDKYFNLFQ